MTLQLNIFRLFAHGVAIDRWHKNVVHISNVKEAKHTSVNRETKTEQTANLISSDYVTENVIIPADILRMKPAAALAHLNPQDESLTEGIKDYWFERLPPDQRDEVVDYALEIIAKNTKFLRLRRRVATMPNGTR